MDQVEQWKPPENPAKDSDSRFDSYKKQFGNKSWELDAIEPHTLAELVSQEVLYERDDDLWNEALERENEVKEKLTEISDTLE